MLITQRPAGYAVQRDGSSLARSSSSPALTRTASGLPASALNGSTVVRVSPVDKCVEKRKDATLGYRGFIPGLRAETVFGEIKTRANSTAHLHRPAPVVDERDPARISAHHWNCPADHPRRGNWRRNVEDIGIWAARQHEPGDAMPGYSGVGDPCERPKPVDFGPAIPGYGGHRHLRRTTGASLQAEDDGTLRPGQRLELPTTMAKSRDCHPSDVHRVLMPGYSGHVRHRDS